MRRLVLCLLMLSSCLDTTLPPLRVESPGVVRAQLVTAVAGRAELGPAQGATVRLVGTTLQATADADGNVTLAGITLTSGRLVFELDGDRDGVPERSRMLSLEEARAGFGRDVNLGQLVLGRNATLVGTVRRSDRRMLASGHGGITVFLPQLPQLTFTGDDGAYTLPGVPEGSLTLTAQAPGYRSEATTVSAGAGREERVAPLVLTADPGLPSIGELRGQVKAVDGTLLSGVSVRAARAGGEAIATTDGDGRFVFQMLAVGVYTLGLEKSGFESLRVDGVLVEPDVNQAGVFVLRAGVGAPVLLDGGPSAPPDGGATASTDGGVGSTDGGAGSDAGTDGGLDGGTGSDAGTDGGRSDAGLNAGNDGGPDSGSGPIALVGPPSTVSPGATATLDGTRSLGLQPLTYTWQQLSGPAVTITPNGTPTAHTATFRAPLDAGVVLTFSLQVTDSFGQASTNSAIARVGVGSSPTARFVPDGGLVSGGATVVFQSTSFDDGGLLIVQHDWSLGAGSAATLIADGGPSAFVTFDAVPFGAPDRLASVELRVTNAIGATSGSFSRVFTVRGGNPTTWAIDAGNNTFVSVGPTPPTVQLKGPITDYVDKRREVMASMTREGSRDRRW